MINVGVVGYGTVGKRVADAIVMQDDMELVGVTARSYNQRILAASKKGFNIYAIADTAELEKHGVSVSGTIHDLLGKVDIVVDGTPNPHGEENLVLYKKHGVKVVLQGGERAECAEASFNANNNFSEAVGKDCVRVVSCNTTALSRVLGAISSVKIGRVNATLLRRAMDPGQKGKTIMNSIEPSFHFPSHHGPDVNTILPDIDISSVAFKVPSTLMHVHSVEIDLKQDVTTDEILALLKKTPRIYVIPGTSGITTTAQIMELAKDLGHPRSDFMEAAVWENGVKVVGNRLYIMMAVHQESIIVPENVDCIRAMMGDEDATASIAKTDKSLGIVK